MSYPDIGLKCFGKTGHLMTNLFLGFSQFGFVCAYVYFIVENVYTMIRDAFNIEIDDSVNIYRILLGTLCIVCFSLLSYVRKIAVFAKAHLWANAMIVFTLTACIIAGIK